MAAQKGIGRPVQVGVAKETTRGTAIASAAYWSPWNDLTLDEKKEFAVDAQSYGVIEDSVQLTQTKAWAQGSLSGNILDQSFGLILYSMFGTLTSHAAHSGETTVFDNIFNVQEGAQHQSLTLFLHDPLAKRGAIKMNDIPAPIRCDSRSCNILILVVIHIIGVALVFPTNASIIAGIKEKVDRRHNQAS
jgi:hypothetical protein